MNHAHDASVPPRVEWKDLVILTPRQVMAELVLPLPWLLLSLVFAERGWWVPAAVASFAFFLGALRTAHDLIHANLGLSRRLNDVLLWLLGLTMFNSLHAVRATHWRHHQHCLEPDDLESQAALGTGLQAILLGPRFTIEIHRAALREGKPHEVRRVQAHLVFVAVALCLAVLLPGWTWLRYHVVAMAFANSLTAFFCVWTVHRGCRAESSIARTLRGSFINWVFFQMFLHLEHHEYPNVPTRNLPKVAERMDAVWEGASSVSVKPALATR